MVGLLEFGRRNVAERFEQAAAVVPRDPLERREFDVLKPLPRPATMDLLRLEQPDHGLRQEHGLDGVLDARVPHGTHPATGLTVWSLYGSDRRPTAAMLQGLDTL